MTENIAASSVSTITRISPAKLNLFLHITGKRTDGYHNLQTVFRLLDWGDYLHFSVSDDAVISTIASELSANQFCHQLLILDGAEAITTSIEDNLIFKAARALLAFAIQSHTLPEQLAKVHIALDKHLPMGAGLGGGSSNAATTMLLLNEIWQLNFTCDELIKIGVTVGADVPIFIFGQDAIAMGIGEELTTIELPDQQYLVLTPNAHVNTATLFAHPKLQRDIAPLSVATIQNRYADYVQTLTTPYHNIFTPVVTSLAPAVADALSYLQGLEAQTLSTARMTGSGSAVFLPLDASIASDKALLAKWVESAPCSGYVVGNL
ncbi:MULTISPECIES: 4-(cytidine 5'-diphospho)-2-C-methyl-D-erythritol kinase [unclassified Psychrobacter]|uniref:4-(cytidine 5'-diphospho)-2-C-methyl-D-erythritol kinase n=1 Tax=unclassified Psychrobacter TaxID=196806 RepID=UPI000C32CA29|nr:MULTISPECIES: 4-(cytidine 5'-diphospho)-2-C-methyl-D-erythritol kinase [unclassified Psychrobacter]MBA6243758.1 4-(cytidine 5'-diphospho)-2-C-methyl-D-erythritol kinase [Psychrobacter sp. Urea-trap-18]MBA6285946.1 4-(cytidine 5'-diphospho)-2-C-methyl-D-erythritol kinase [Psychrobacter sp. Urea-trap-16]MBA6319439.1 4-(cytidine 5'-diphospho)-2-C-methyl-D-erythritol kinase [Psychrobacter sp. Urea-trap-20]MBA6334190.1 4-(cytidine 5'-diphospho)-2-C-methyl-D-erythritol kinase [Psychrobacter sp. Ur